MRQRIQKLISAGGMASRRTAEEWIAAGRVTVNGETASLGDQADPDVDTVAVDGRPLEMPPEHIWLMLNKPRGVVVTLSDEKGRKTAADLVADCGRRVWPAGRLDMDSEGLLLFTDDGEMTNRLLHPRHGVEKEYLVWAEGDLEQALPLLRGPMDLDGEHLPAPVRVRQGRTTGDVHQLSVTITQGKNRQVRRMCAAAGLKVVRLKRIREGGVELDRNLKPGQWRMLTPGEVQLLAGKGPD